MFENSCDFKQYDDVKCRIKLITTLSEKVLSKWAPIPNANISSDTPEVDYVDIIIVNSDVGEVEKLGIKHNVFKYMSGLKSLWERVT